MMFCVLGLMLIVWAVFPSSRRIRSSFRNISIETCNASLILMFIQTLLLSMSFPASLRSMKSKQQITKRLKMLTYVNCTHTDKVRRSVSAPTCFSLDMNHVLFNLSLFFVAFFVARHKNTISIHEYAVTKSYY